MEALLAKTNGRHAPFSALRLKRRGGKKTRQEDRGPAFTGWLSSDAEEIERRRWRGRTEVTQVEPLDSEQAIFGAFRVSSAEGAGYEVEIRALDRPLNSCGCADHRVNGLGTCKHVEAVLARLRRRHARSFDTARRLGSPRVELFLTRAGMPAPRLLLPADKASCRAVRSALAPFLGAGDELDAAAPERLEAVLAAVAALRPQALSQIRVSRHLAPWIADRRRRQARAEARAHFLAEAAAGRQALDVLRCKLLPYQRDGMLHLAFGERALLADDMGLGKTVQAIAACELKRRLDGISRVLVVTPASLKGEWQEQIARFSGAATVLVNGPRAARLVQYATPGFFTLVNYEQVVADADDINRLVRPDIVILDEAQRIKNWQTKTARRVKALASPAAYVLTGTPIENRIDEIYSIVQYLEPGLLGPLFRFNRDFYELDERGRPVGYKNLDVLMQRLKPVMLRRRKRDVEAELPRRSVKNHLVAMADEQRLRYDEYKGQAARLLHAAQRRPLTPAEHERLHRLLACMRMLCDTPYILDPQCRVSPKLEELERVLGDLLADPERKVIVFSEWERMLELARELARDMGVEFAWHTGTVPQQRRRAEIDRFKRDPGCRVFLSTESGGVGLNLQVASAVINLDLPWNPAKLEQRIARAWRKNQKRSVDVINLVTEDSIEHSMLHVLSRKQALADGVLDGDGSLKAMALRSGRGAFVERMTALMAPSAVPSAAPLPAPSPGAPALVDALKARHGEKLLLVEQRRAADGSALVLAVLDDAAVVEAERRRELAPGETPVEVLDRGAYETMQRLGTGTPPAAPEPLFRSPLLDPPETELAAERRQRGTALLGDAGRKLRMALLLAEGGFAAEALPALEETLALATAARGLLAGRDEANAAPAGSAPVPDAPPRPLADIAAALEQTLAALRRNAAPAA